MHVTDRQWTYQVIARFTAAEAKRLFALSRDARIAQNREPEGGTDDNEASG